MPSIHPGVELPIRRWKKTSQAMLGNNQFYAERVIKKVMTHSYTNFYGIKDPLEAAVFAALVKMEKEIDDIRVVVR